MPLISAAEKLVNHDSLRLILAIAKAGSFTRAATVLGISQPAVSQQIRRIEQVLGTSLFRRTNAGIELTPDGEAAHAYAEQIEALTANFCKQISESGPKDVVRIGMAEDFCRTALAQTLRFFRRYFPEHPIHITSGTYETLANSTAAQTVDLVVMRQTGRIGEPEPFWREPMRWVGSASLSLPLADPIPLVIPTAPNPVRDVAMRTLRTAGRKWCVTFEGSTLAAIEAAMEAGLGVCLAPGSMHFENVRTIGAEGLLPLLPEIGFIMLGPKAEAAPPVHAFATIFRKTAEFVTLQGRPASQDGTDANLVGRESGRAHREDGTAVDWGHR